MAVMNYKQTNRYPDGTGMLLDTTPGTPDSGSYTTEAQLKAWINADIISGAQVVGKAQKDQNGNVIDATYATKAEVNALSARVSNLEQTTKQDEQTVQYPDDGNYSSIMPNGVPARVAKYGEVAGIRGKSRGWNQLAKAQTITNFCTKVSDTEISVNYSTSSTIYAQGTEHFSTISGHKYLLYITGSSGLNLRTSAEGIVPYLASVSDGYLGVVNGDGTNNSFLSLINTSSSGSGTVRILVRDLTPMFPEGVPATVAECVQKCPDLLKWDAYGYSLVDTTVEGVVSKSRNLIDYSIMEMGFFDPTTGVKVTNTSGNYWRIPQMVEVKPLTDYYITFPTGYSINNANSDIVFYDAEGNFIEYKANRAGTTTTSPFSASYANVSYFFITARSTAPEGACLNASDNNNGTYTPYLSPQTLMLSAPVELKEAGAIEEVLTVETGKKTRPIGSYTFTGNETVYGGTNGNFNTPDLGSVIKDISGPTVKANLLMAGYVTRTYSDVNDMIYPMTVGFFSGTVTFYNPSVTSNAGAKSELAGKTIYYELTTPASDEQVCDPIIDNYIEVEGGGTINTIQSQTPVIDNCLDVTYDFIPV